MCALCLVLGIVAIAFVHGIVVNESHLVARQVLHAIIGKECGVHSAVPHTALQHAASVILTFAVATLGCCTEDEGAAAAIADVIKLTYQGVVVESQLLFVVIQYHSYMLEASRADGRLAGICRVNIVGC